MLSICKETSKQMKRKGSIDDSTSILNNSKKHSQSIKSMKSMESLKKEQITKSNNKVEEIGE